MREKQHLRLAVKERISGVLIAVDLHSSHVSLFGCVDVDLDETVVVPSSSVEGDDHHAGREHKDGSEENQGLGSSPPSDVASLKSIILFSRLPHFPFVRNCSA